MIEASPTIRQDPRAPHRVVVTAVEDLTPNMRRITFEGETLAEINVPLPAQWLKVVLTGQDGALSNRAYTIRRFNPGKSSIEIDFVLHGDAGPASAWAKRASIGVAVQLGAPRGGFKLEPVARWMLLAGDETALPAIASILEEAPRAGDRLTRVVLEVSSEDDVQRLPDTDTTRIDWLIRDKSKAHGTALMDWVADLHIQPEPGQIFLAGEAASVAAMRRNLTGRVPAASIDAKGYWRFGHADHRDAFSA